MPPLPEATFLNTALNSTLPPWSEQAVMALAELRVPDRFQGRNSQILRADIHRQWALWFAESIFDPRVVKDASYPYVFEAAYKALVSLFPDCTLPERRDLAREIASSLSATASSNRQRKTYDRSLRSTLLALAGAPPRCWICGATFLTTAIRDFLDRTTTDHTLPSYVDVFKPRGLQPRDYAIEIDHVIPLARGGGEGDNLRLACGWCNRSKRDYLTVYDVAGAPHTIQSGRGTPLRSLPRALWVTRILATRGICEHDLGCGNNVRTAELTVCLRFNAGAANPINLRVTCYEHAPHLAERLLPLPAAKVIWDEARRAQL